MGCILYLSSCRDKGVISKYIGETSWTMAKRNKEHQEDYWDSSENSQIKSHMLQEHPEQMHNILELFVMRKIESCSSVFSRQVREVVKITQDQSPCLLTLRKNITTVCSLHSRQRIQMSLEPKKTPALTQSQEETALEIAREKQSTDRQEQMV